MNLYEVSIPKMGFFVAQESKKFLAVFVPS